LRREGRGRLTTGFALPAAERFEDDETVDSNGRGGGDAPKHPLVGRWAGDRLVVQGDYAKDDDAAYVPEDVRESCINISAEVKDMLHATPLGLRLTKEALNHAIDAGGLEATIAMEDRNQILASSDGDFAEGVRAFLEKREPDYSKREG
jgi:enoyl-CoA hydratase/carnithine racemase